MVDSYLCTDGKPISVSPLYQGDANLKTLVINRDPRLNQTICVDDDQHVRFFEDNTFFMFPKFGGSIEETCPTGYQLYKGHGQSNSQQRGLATPVAWIYFRYAEALLIYAEARAELGEITQNDIDKTINTLRKRVGMNDGLLDMNNIITDPNWQFTSISPLLNEIRRERKVELACESFRLDDIFRWAAADVCIKGYIPRGAVWSQWTDFSWDGSYEDGWNALDRDDEGYILPYKIFPAVSATGYNFNLNRDYLSPLPTNELTLNTALGQNPGW
jgi:hypothetical protein